jgi:hypothetical protein
MVIEVYLDTADLKDTQTLVMVDDDGKRWDVLEQLNASASSDGSYTQGQPRKTTEVIVERWKVELKVASSIPSEDFGPTLPTIYKKAIVFFRSLFVTTRLLPAWRFASRSAATATHPALTPRCRMASPRSNCDSNLFPNTNICFLSAVAADPFCHSAVSSAQHCPALPCRLILSRLVWSRVRSGARPMTFRSRPAPITRRRS